MFEWPFSYTGQLYALLFPKLLHPLTTTVVTCQTYLIVVIAFERFDCQSDNDDDDDDYDTEYFALPPLFKSHSFQKIF